MQLIVVQCTYFETMWCVYEKIEKMNCWEWVECCFGSWPLTPRLLSLIMFRHDANFTAQRLGNFSKRGNKIDTRKFFLQQNFSSKCSSSNANSISTSLSKKIVENMKLTHPELIVSWKKIIKIFWKRRFRFWNLPK